MNFRSLILICAVGMAFGQTIIATRITCTGCAIMVPVGKSEIVSLTAPCSTPAMLCYAILDESSVCFEDKAHYICTEWPTLPIPKELQHAS